MTVADQAMLAIATRILVDWVRQAEQIRLDLLDLRDLLPHVNRTHARLGKLAEACDLMVMAGETGMRAGSADWTRARYDAGEALEAIYRHRAAMTIERFREERVGA